MDERDALLTEIAEHCDIEQRLRDVPSSAKVRGVSFQSVAKVLENAGLAAEYDRIFPGTHSTLVMYPAHELLQRVAIAGALLRSPEEVHAGMYEVGRHNAISFAESLLGRTVLRLLSRDPYRLLQQGVSGRRQTGNYGRWTLERTGERDAVMHFEQEYAWIDSYMLGGGVGTFESVGVTGDFRLELDDPYNGRHIITW